MNNDLIHLLAGSDQVISEPWALFSDDVIDFLGELSKDIRKLSIKQNSPELMATAFWMRKKHLLHLQETYSGSSRVGLGITFHIAPSNIPYMFLYTMAAGLLAGNSCIIRISDKQMPQAESICLLIDHLLNKPDFQSMRRRIAIITYNREDICITSSLSKTCDARIIWGGDASVSAIRQFPLKPSASELIFPDRASICLINADRIVNLSEEELDALTLNFYNDTYSMDQNACSSPKIIFWQESSVETGQHASTRFWNSLKQLTDHYEAAEIMLSEKYCDFWELAGSNPSIDRLIQFSPALYVMQSNCPPQPNVCEHLRFGSFVEYHMKSGNEWMQTISEKIQTLTYYGLDACSIRIDVLQNHLCGITRIVPIGQALSFSLIWDGKDIIAELSRHIDICF